ncbi:MAG: carbohydrate kinase family protein [Methanomicrobiales archaeon]|nr:carbohydrate kinase family protein [Methanomicrobiales archaeon]
MISVVGHTAIDHISRVPRFPPVNGSINILDRKVYFGGGAANIAAGIARLNEPCTLISAVGGDFSGSDFEQWMERLGIVRKFYTLPGAHTATAFMFTDEAGDQITFFEWGASVAFEREEAPFLPFVHMATADPGFNVKVAERSEFATFDPGQDLHRYTKEQLDAILGTINVLFANQHEITGMEIILGTSREEIISRVPMVVITLGKEGSVLHEKGNSSRIPVFPVTMADPTGAGDAYRAGFLTAYHRGYGPLTACKIGTITASFAVESIGCQTNLPDWDQMEARYGKFFGSLLEPTRSK